MIDRTTYSSWLDIPTSLFKCPADNQGAATTYRDILFSRFGQEHEYFFRLKKEDPWITGTANDLRTMISIRKDPDRPDKAVLKQSMQCFTPSGLFESKKKGSEKLIKLNPLLQVDIDHISRMGVNIEQIKAAIFFELPYVVYVGKSVTGTGLCIFFLIAEPEKLRQYAEHVFQVLMYYNLPVDPSKGRNYTDLRFVSYDANMLIREEASPLEIKRFHTVPKPQKPITCKQAPPQSDKQRQRLIDWACSEINIATKGNRWPTVQRVSFSMGGHGFGLSEIIESITQANEFAGEESKYITCAQDCFSEGIKKPFAFNE